MRIPIYEYLNVDPLRDYWYCDAEKMVWVICRHDRPTQNETKPVLWEHLTTKGKREHPELRPTRKHEHIS